MNNLYLRLMFITVKIRKIWRSPGIPNNLAALAGINICARLNFTTVQFLKLIQQFRNEKKNDRKTKHLCIAKF